MELLRLVLRGFTGFMVSFVGCGDGMGMGMSGLGFVSGLRDVGIGYERVLLACCGGLWGMSAEWHVRGGCRDAVGWEAVVDWASKGDAFPRLRGKTGWHYH